MRYLQGMSLLLMYLKYTNQLDIHGATILLPIFIDFLYLWIVEILRVSKIIKLQKDREEFIRKYGKPNDKE